MTDLARLLHEPDASVAVVGATDDPSKYGSVIYRHLKAKGFEVYAVNPNRDTVDGDPAYPTLADLPVRPTVVNFVVPPDQTLRVLEQARDLGLTNVWIQPGAQSAEVHELIDENGFNALVNACIMVRTRMARPSRREAPPL